MGRAAARLRVAQSALSRQLQDLEREAGVVLLERLSRGIRLTAAGAAFLSHARRALEAADDAMSAARAAAEGLTGRLRVAPPDYGARASLVAAAIAALRARHPNVAVELVASPWTEHIDLLRSGRLEVGFAIGGPPADYPPDIVAESLDHEPLAWAMLPERHPLAGREALTLAALAAEPMVLGERAAIPAIHEQVTRALRRAGFEPRIVTAPASFAAVAQLVAGGAGWCPVVESVAARPPGGTRIVPVPELERDCHLEFSVLHLRAGPSVLVEELLSHLRNQTALDR